MKMPSMEEKKADKDHDGDGKVESGTDEYMGSRDKAIKKAMGKEETTEHKEDEDPCWKDYEMQGTKKKGGKTVPNCVKKSDNAEETYSEISIPEGWSVSNKIYKE